MVSNRERHGVVGAGPADEGSGLVDVLGARTLSGFQPDRWARHLPRWSVATLLERQGLPRAAGEPAPLDAVRARGAQALMASSAAVVGFPALAGNLPAVVQGRALVVRVGVEVGFHPSELEHALGVTRQAVNRLRRRDLADALRLPLLRRIGFDLALKR